jgi:uncharacterized membrane protein
MIHLARAAHVLGVVWWIGGVAMVTATLLPLLVRREPSEPERLAVFRQIRRRFAWQARGSVLLVGATGAYLLGRLGGLARLGWPAGWWIDLMILTWGLFFMMLFVLEPLGALQKAGLMQKPRAFLALHIVLLGLGLAAIAASVVGAHGGW